MRRQVVLLAGIFLQIEKLFAAILGAPDVFKVSVRKRMKSLFLAVTGRMFEVQPWTGMHTGAAQ